MISDSELWQKGFDMIGDSSTRDQGFELLLKLGRGVMDRYLRSLETSKDDRDDIISTVTARIWESRNHRHYPSVASFVAFIKLSANNERKDYKKSAHSRHTTSDEQIEDTADEVSDEFTELLEEYFDDHGYVQVANNLWLGKEPPECRARLLVATMIFRDRSRLRIAMQALSNLDRKPRDMSTAEVMKWITDRAVLRRLTYSTMHHEPEQLFNTVVNGDQLDPNHEAALLWRRLVNFNSRRRIVESLPEEDRMAAQETLHKYEAKLPFATSLETLLTNIRRYDDQVNIFSEPGIWKRLIFQYNVYKLPHEDMVEWFGKPAKIVNFKLDQMTIHSWVSNGILRKELRKAYDSGEWI